MGEGMLVTSVILPVYNHEKYLVQCLDSVRDSDYKHIELIIIDDGSTDNSSAVISSWLEVNSDRFLRTVFERQVNAGVCKTANRLIGLSQGDIIIALASDDALLPTGISRRVEFLQNHPHLLAVFGDAALMDAQGRITCRELEKNLFKANKSALADPRFISSELILKWCVPGPVFAAWKRTYDPVDGIGLYDESLQFEDRDFYLRLLSRQALGYIPDEVALYRHSEQSLAHAPEKSISNHQHLLLAEKMACKRFRGSERVFLELMCLRCKAHILFLSSGKRMTYFLLDKLMKLTVELTYRLHKLAFIIVSMLSPSEP